ncbi:MAG: hypothetical protein Q8K28_09495 [Hoeflea sp.]|uniref:hypothetical protein n=1 Tax=Hoeflea sp. TaxID=1940281 RepID=UPI002731CBDF|nr:hypothetical protein [Hoeflea sp.]MDP2120124.1 hypothetical protein [Hoeflea sp.]
MSDAPRYTFRIEDFTPESMPFGRLVEYYSEIKRMLGVAENMHLTNVFESSHGSAFAVDRNYETKLVRRLTEISQGTAPKSAKRAHNSINAMLKEDGTSGRFCDPQGHSVIIFPGKRIDESNALRVRDAASFVGEIYHIAGTQYDAKVRISTDTYGAVFCTTTREIAKSLRDFLFEDVKVNGRGVWSRTADGDWDISDFVITDFAPIKRESLRDSVDRIRRLEINWPNDTLAEIAAFDEKSGAA